uniref:Kinesin-related protein 11 n=1 Tax=Noccaea caerulescens TaxID=107243 RepID=A0A1J3FD01_NOCCA
MSEREEMKLFGILTRIRWSGLNTIPLQLTHSGDQDFPGIIPLAIKDVFSIIQDTTGREFLLRLSYLEIYIMR